MTIYKTKTLEETYRFKAGSRDINELNGRPGRRDLTDFVAEQILGKIRLNAGDILIDVGCGDGTLLKKIMKKGFNKDKCRILGILPSQEEVNRVKQDFFQNDSVHYREVSIIRGKAEEIDLPNDFCDHVICNSVLHGSGQRLVNVKSAIEEFNRVMKIGGQLYIGEMPEINELDGKNYGSSVIGWLIYLIRTKGMIAFISGLKTVIISLLTEEPFIITPKFMFFIKPVNFEEMLQSYGFRLLEKMRHYEIDNSGNRVVSKTRWNYKAVKDKSCYSSKDKNDS